ncbi:MAG TPA: lipoprotein [Povalibacter sp.]|nr:lipoprotein [Povalibacter sp.]
MRDFRSLWVLSLVGAVLTLAGCGQKGPLYRPEEPPQRVDTGATTPPPAPSDKKKSQTTFPAPQIQKEHPATRTPPPSDAATQPPAVDPDRPASPPPGTRE